MSELVVLRQNAIYGAVVEVHGKRGWQHAELACREVCLRQHRWPTVPYVAYYAEY
jgi:hypothetical protein